MNSITFGKDSYHLNGYMEIWCQENIGPGKWTYSGVKDWDGLGEDIVWAMHSMFGNTTFTFKRPKDFTWFVLRWSSEH